ncbi:chorismate mutase aro7 [Elasticomyces elasticus]|nr:chorismate mutase aro7 [Elasticomyces elasticus]
MDSALDLPSPNEALSLPHIRAQLIRLEDTVLFHLIERAQFPLNSTIYQPGAIPIDDGTADLGLSFMDWVLRSQEQLQAKIRRYQSPDEYPFFPDAIKDVQLVLPALKYPEVLYANDVCVTTDLKSRYVNSILPNVCKVNAGRKERAEAQENYGSAATADVNCLQSLSRRIHFGKFVAESKFLESPDKFSKLIKAEDRKGIDDAITNSTVEKQVLERLKKKAEMYGADPNLVGESGGAGTGVRKIEGEAVVAMYRDHVIPLTKEVEVEYLMQRLRGTEWE